MGWLYSLTCLFDFVLAPILWNIIQAYFMFDGSIINPVFTQWKPITLEGSGLYHLSMGAVVGINAWSRGQEKLNRVATDQ